MEQRVIKVMCESDGAMEVLNKFLDGRSDMWHYSTKDELEKVSAQVEKLGEALKAYKESGINWRVFNRYLRGCGIPQADIDKVLDGTEKFFKDLGVEIK